MRQTFDNLGVDFFILPVSFFDDAIEFPFVSESFVSEFLVAKSAPPRYIFTAPFFISSQ
ncbi:hypothetical protein [Anaerorudis cellulosivorans]|uniref:hypothetical protein n=1 Tax=Anaerorudis cellulosivorans TaxID=3397862 RepID=UPI00221EAB2A|nr:hypothetical protein [Seramator thermalis]MCW1735085.1 hypothetical protein [Seramator thermalis]